jgi:hypothetical protein
MDKYQMAFLKDLLIISQIAKAKRIGNKVNTNRKASTH